jgi:folate-binding protein YgfZ
VTVRTGPIAATLERAVVRVSGEEPLAFLHAMTSQELASLRPGQGALTCLLDERAHVLAEARALVLDDRSVLLDAEPAARGALVERLGRVAPLSACAVIDETGEWHLRPVRDSEDRSSPDGAEHSFAERDGALVVRVEWGGPGVDLLVRERAPASNADAYESARIAGGRPRFGIDVTPDLIVNETPLIERAVSFTKGCYPGQETVARIRNLGRARRALVGLDSDALLRAGAPVRAGDREVGRVTSAAGTWAIALVRAEAAEEPLLVEGTPVRARTLW